MYICMQGEKIYRKKRLIVFFFNFLQLKFFQKKKTSQAQPIMHQQGSHPQPGVMQRQNSQTSQAGVLFPKIFMKFFEIFCDFFFGVFFFFGFSFFSAGFIWACFIQVLVVFFSFFFSFSWILLSGRNQFYFILRPKRTPVVNPHFL